MSPASPYNMLLIHIPKSALLTRTICLQAGGSETAVSTMRLGLKKFGWEVDSSLPPGWLKKEGLGRPLYYSPGNTKLEGKTELLDHLLEEGQSFQV